MPTYIPNAADSTQPTEDKTVESAALEFRTLKSAVTTLSQSLTGSTVASIVATQNFVGNGVQVVFQLLASVESTTYLDIYINGIHQDITTYSVSGTELTLSVPPDAGFAIEVRIGVPISGGSTSSDIVQYLPVSGIPTTVQSKLRESVSVKDFGAVGNGAANDTVAIQNAVTYCIANGTALTWPTGNYLTTDNLVGLHQVAHTGAGIVVRGSNLFPVEPRTTQAVNIYVSSTGVVSNDGLSVSFPTTITTAAELVLPNYGPILQGNWVINCAAGLYDQYATRPDFKGYGSANYITVKGPDVGGHPNVPTAVFDMQIGHSSPSNASCFYASGEMLKMCFKDIKVQRTNGAAITMEFGELQTINLHSTDCKNGLSVSAGANLGVFGGLSIFTADDTDEYAHIKELFHVRHSIGYDNTAAVYTPANWYPDSTIRTATGYVADGQSIVITDVAHGFELMEYVNVTIKTVAGATLVNSMFRLTAVTADTYTIKSNKAAGTDITDVAVATTRRVGISKAAGTYTSTTTELTTTVASHRCAVGDLVLAVLGQAAGSNVLDGIRTVTATTPTSITVAIANAGGLTGVAYIYRVKSLDGTTANTMPLFVGTGQGRAILAQENCTGHIVGLFHRFSQAVSIQSSSRGHLEHAQFCRNGRAVSFGIGSNVFLNHTILNERTSFANTTSMDDVGGTVANLDGNPVSHKIGTLSVLSSDLSISAVTDNGSGFCRIYTSVPSTAVVGASVYIDAATGITAINGTRSITAVAVDFTYFDVAVAFSGTYTGSGIAMFLPNIITGVTSEVTVGTPYVFCGSEFNVHRKIRCVISGVFAGTAGYKLLKLYFNGGIVSTLQFIATASGSFHADLGFVKLYGDYVLPVGTGSAGGLSAGAAISDVSTLAIINRATSIGYSADLDVRVQLENAADSVQIYMVQVFKE